MGRKSFIVVFFAISLMGCLGSDDSSLSLTESHSLGVTPKDTPETRLGERLFRETRFSQFFFERSRGDVNATLSMGDPVLEAVPSSRRGQLKSPFAGQTMSCVACHMVTDAKKVPGAGVRTYADFSDRSGIPVRPDAALFTPRNSPPLVNAFIDRPGPFLLHYDGEFSTIEDLVVGGFTGRNFGWLPKENPLALANIARVVRDDDGKGSLARQMGGKYATLLEGSDPGIPAQFRISEKYQVKDVRTADDSALVRRVAELVAIYLKKLEFSKDLEGQYNASPYDVFLKKNSLPRRPNPGESDIAYAGRLSWAIAQLTNPVFVKDSDGEFESHLHEFRFGELELRGLRIFFARSTNPTLQETGFKKVGNCVACHAPPHFTDFAFHNTGESQDEYDSIHGNGAFSQLPIPSYAERIKNFDRYFPANPSHPDALGAFRAVPARDRPGQADLGLWNIFGNPDVPAPQGKLRQMICPEGNCETDETLSKTVALFKTPGLRDLGHSDPYFHTGRKKSIEEVLHFYRKISEQAQGHQLRNGDPELAKVDLDLEDTEALAAFLKALDEEYE